MLWGRRSEKRIPSDQPTLFDLQLPLDELSAVRLVRFKPRKQPVAKGYVNVAICPLYDTAPRSPCLANRSLDTTDQTITIASSRQLGDAGGVDWEIFNCDHRRNTRYSLEMLMPRKITWTTYSIPAVCGRQCEYCGHIWTYVVCNATGTSREKVEKQSKAMAEKSREWAEFNLAPQCPACGQISSKVLNHYFPEGIESNLFSTVVDKLTARCSLLGMQIVGVVIAFCFFAFMLTPLCSTYPNGDSGLSLLSFMAIFIWCTGSISLLAYSGDSGLPGCCGVCGLLIAGATFFWFHDLWSKYYLLIVLTAYLSWFPTVGVFVARAAIRRPGIRVASLFVFGVFSLYAVYRFIRIDRHAIGSDSDQASVLFWLVFVAMVILLPLSLTVLQAAAIRSLDPKIREAVARNPLRQLQAIHRDSKSNPFHESVDTLVRQLIRSVRPWFLAFGALIFYSLAVMIGLAVCATPYLSAGPLKSTSFQPPRILNVLEAPVEYLNASLGLPVNVSDSQSDGKDEEGVDAPDHDSSKITTEMPAETSMNEELSVNDNVPDSRTNNLIGDSLRVESNASDPPPITKDAKSAVTSIEREWVDASGNYRVVASFVELRDNQVVLLRRDSQTISVPIHRLSTADQEYLSAWQTNTQSRLESEDMMRPNNP